MENAFLVGVNPGMTSMRLDYIGQCVDEFIEAIPDNARLSLEVVGSEFSRVPSMTVSRESRANGGFEPSSLRKTVIRMAYAGSTVHIGCAFSLIEILAVLYREHLYFGSGPDDPTRDYLVLSKGHGVMAQYACMYELGLLTDLDIQCYFGDGTRLKGLSDAHVPGLEVTSGSLGHGLPIGVGLALGAKKQGTNQRCFVIVGDGEMNEGSMWEALLFARQFKLDNMIVIVDLNGYQAMGSTEEVMTLGCLREKFEAFGFEAREVDGHDQTAISGELRALLASDSQRPKALVARTIKGFGLTFTADDNAWHYSRLTAETFKQAMSELGEQAGDA